MQFIVMYVGNMLRLESGVMGELVGSTILVSLVDRLIELDVSCLRFSDLQLVGEETQP